MQLSNNRISSNRGNYGGGIRIGHPYITDGAGVVSYVNASNDNISIHNNQIMKNGTVGIAGAGIALFTGSSSYQVTENFICANFSGQDGAGIGHFGLSDNGFIADNTILYNQSFQQTAGAGGGGAGILIAGGNPLPGAMSSGSGSVTIDSNLIQSNLAGSDDGGGIETRYVNGDDVLTMPIASWYSVGIYNNTIVNNITGSAGAIAMQDSVNVKIVNNTIANNDSTATAAKAFNGGAAGVSSPQSAGVVGRAHTSALITALGGGGATFSDPLLINNIIWHNRSFYWDASQNSGSGGLLPATPLYDDLAVLGTATAEQLTPQSGILSDITGYPGNSAGPPDFVSEYFNGARNWLVTTGGSPNIKTIPAFDEGGNYIDISFGPLSQVDPATGNLFGDYHINAASPAISGGLPLTDIRINGIAELSLDIEDDVRPSGGGVDIGSDEYFTVGMLNFDADADGVKVGNGDCNDNNAAIYPGAIELVGDGIDQDCNGYDLTIVITKAKYWPKSKSVIINATSTLNGNAALKVTVPGVGTRKMWWNTKKGIWQKKLKNVTLKPGTVSVHGIEGALIVPVK